MTGDPFTSKILSVVSTLTWVTDFLTDVTSSWYFVRTTFTSFNLLGAENPKSLSPTPASGESMHIQCLYGVTDIMAPEIEGDGPYAAIIAGMQRLSQQAAGLNRKVPHPGCRRLGPKFYDGSQFPRSEKDLPQDHRTYAELCRKVAIRPRRFGRAKADGLIPKNLRCRDHVRWRMQPGGGFRGG